MTATVAELLVPGPAIALAGLLNRPSEDIADGWSLPDLWHWVYLLDRPAQAALGPEGHPLNGIPQPPAPGLRRMFAGGRVHTIRRLQVGRPALRAVDVLASRTRSGRSGPMTIVTTRATIAQDGEVCVVDEQDIIYRTSAPLYVSEGSDEGNERVAEVVRTTALDSTVLFRFSALTYNAHRIHYDVDYCRNDENYDNLVVHGPLQALLMAEAAESMRPLVDGAYFDYRLVSPLTLGQGLHVRANSNDTTIDSVVTDDTGRVSARSSRSQRL